MRNSTKWLCWDSIEVLSSSSTIVSAHSCSAGFIVVLFSVCWPISPSSSPFSPTPVFSHPFTYPPSLPPTSSPSPPSSLFHPLLFLSLLTIPSLSFLLFSPSLLCTSNSLSSWSSMYQGTWCPPCCGHSPVTAR